MTFFGGSMPRLTAAFFGSLLAAATLFGCSEDPATTAENGRSGTDVEQQTPASSNAEQPAVTFDDNFTFTPAELEAALNPLEDAIDDSEIATGTNVFLREGKDSYGIRSRCPQVFHEPIFTFRQVATGGSLDVLVLRDVHLYPNEAATRDAFVAVAATPEGCNSSPLTAFDEPVTAVEVWQFQGLDAITVQLDVMAVGDIGVDSELAEYWVRRGNVVVHVRVQDDATNVDVLLSDALASIDTLAR